MPPRRSSEGFLAWLDKNYKKIGTLILLLGAILSVSWKARDIYQELVEKIAEMGRKQAEIERQQAEAKLTIADLNKKYQQIRSFLRLRHATSLEDFNVICGAGQGTQDHNFKVCRFDELELWEDFHSSSALPPKSPAEKTD